MQTVAYHFAGGGRYRGSGPIVDVKSPIDGSASFRVHCAGEAEVEAALAGAQAAAPEMATLDVAVRANALRALAGKLVAHGPEIAEAITLENGCPSRQALPLQVSSAAAVLDAYARLAEEHAFEEIRPGMRGGRVIVQKMPVGVSVGIVPWNVPIFLSCMKIAPAIAAGCPIVIKPSLENAPSAAMFAELVADLELPAGAISVVTGGVELGRRLVADERVAKVSFTGSTDAGKHVGTTCISRLCRVTLELGGKSAGVILDDVDLESVIPELLGAMLQNNGQICGALSRVLLPARYFEAWSSRLAGAFDELCVGDPRDASTDIGPLVSAKQRDRVLSVTGAALAGGARALTRGRALSGSRALSGASAMGEARAPGGARQATDRGYYVEPTLLVNVSPDMPTAREEVFGPIVVAMPYESENEAVAIANDSMYGLSGSVWSSDAARAEQIARTMSSGTVAVNSKKILDFGSPFGGMRASGIGRELGHEGIDAYLEPKSILLPA